MLNFFYHICSYLFHLRRSGVIEYYPCSNPNLMHYISFWGYFPASVQNVGCPQKLALPVSASFLGVKPRPPHLKTNHDNKKSSNPEIRNPTRRIGRWGSTIWRRNASRKSSRTRPWCLGARISSVQNRRVGKLESPSPKKEVSVWEDESFFVHMFLFFKLGDVEWCLVMFFFRFLDVYASFIGLECVCTYRKERLDNRIATWPKIYTSNLMKHRRGGGQGGHLNTSLNYLKFNFIYP